MRHYYFILFISFVAASCVPKTQDKEFIKQDYLSSWFIQNEDSLYKEFENHVAKNSLCAKCDTTWGEMAYIQFDSLTLMGQFSNLVTKYCDSLQVTYFYNKNSGKRVRILLSTGYNKKFTTALDSLFTGVPKPKHFIVEKYEQAETGADIYSLNNVDVIVKDLRIQITTIDTLKNMTVYINARPKDTAIDFDNKEFFTHQIFGEEMLLKKINNVNIKFCDTIKQNLLSLNEALLKLK
jgi:hypothetical protein